MYDAVNAKIDMGANPPAGLIVHTAGEVDGQWQVVDVWETREDAERFDNERLIPAITEVAGPGGPRGPQMTVYEAHNVVSP
jgi:hypothetical protein